MRHPLKELIERNGAAVIDGAMSTALERLGCNLNNRLWSALVLLQSPEKIRQVHRDYFDAGANIAITSSYQVSEVGFLAEGHTRAQTAACVALSVRLAQEARSAFLAEHPESNPEDYLVAGGVGPYGAYLANGSEYTGNYHLTTDEYRAFHALRFEMLVQAESDLLAIETVPNFEEAKVLLSMAEQADMSCWISFTLRDATAISDGTPLEEVATLCEASPSVDAFGLNCVKRELVEGALTRLRSHSSKPLLVYPNSGEVYDAKTKTWSHPPQEKPWGDFIGKWHALGAVCLGGCCRTLPTDITQIAKLVQEYRRLV